MRARRLAVILVCCLVAAGCESTRNPFDPPKPLDKMTKEELCGYYTFFLTDPNLSAQTRQIAQSKMRQKGCAA